MNKELMVIIGRKWQDINGNTYHTSEIITRDKYFNTPIEYGYGNQFIVTAREYLRDKGINIDDYFIKDVVIYVERKKEL